METTRKRYNVDFKAGVALEAFRRNLTLAELGTRHGIHHTMIAVWKRPAINGMASTLAGASEGARASGKAEFDKLYPRSGNYSWNGFFWPKPSVDECRSKAQDSGRGSP